MNLSPAPTTNPEVDLRARWKPSDEQLAAAAEALAAAPAADFAVIAIALPGKEHGWWKVGQQVEPVEFPDGDLAKPATNTFDTEGPLLGFGHLRGVAEDAALAHLAATERDGMGSYGTVDRDGTFAVWEGWISAFEYVERVTGRSAS